MTTIWLMPAILIALILIGIVVLVVVIKQKRRLPPDYRALFIMGVIWLPAGIIIKNYILSAMGVVFMVAGLIHKKDWKKNRRRWSDLTEGERKLKIFIMIVLAVLLVLGLVVYFLTEGDITSL